MQTLRSTLRWWVDLDLWVKITAILGLPVTIISLFLSQVNKQGESSNVAPPTPSLSASATALIKHVETCSRRLPPPSSPDIKQVSITSPKPEAVVDAEALVHGTANLSITDRLYFFAYGHNVCTYYFMPWDPVTVLPDGTWQAKLLVGANRGERIAVYAAVVDADGHAALQEVLRYYEETQGRSPSVTELPPRTRTAHVFIQVSHRP